MLIHQYDMYFIKINVMRQNGKNVYWVTKLYYEQKACINSVFWQLFNNEHPNSKLLILDNRFSDFLADSWWLILLRPRVTIKLIV